MGGVGVTELDNLYRFVLKIKGISREVLGRDQLRRKLAWEARFPEGLDEPRLDLFMNGRDVPRRGNCLRIGKLVEQSLQTEVVVAVAWVT